MCCSVFSSQNNIQKGVGRGRVFWAWACKTATEAWVAFFIFFFVNFGVVSVRKVKLQFLAQ
jgi:hypothetical protein